MTRAVIRLRSSIKGHREVKETLAYLRLNRVNHCVLVPEGKSYDGMLQKVKDYVTWGEIKPDVLTNMILKRGKLNGERPITNQYIIENTKHASLLKFAEAIVSGQYKYSDLKEVKPVFRLHPPLQGFEGIKRAFNDRGSLGYRGAAINELILRMLSAPAAKPEAPKAAKAAPIQAAVAHAPEKPKKAPARKAEDKAAPTKKKAETGEAAPKKAPAKKKAAPKEESK